MGAVYIQFLTHFSSFSLEDVTAMSYFIVTSLYGETGILKIYNFYFDYLKIWLYVFEYGQSINTVGCGTRKSLLLLKNSTKITNQRREIEDRLDILHWRLQTFMAFWIIAYTITNEL